jgi:hypothetical protein
MNKQEIEDHIKETTEKAKAQSALVASLETQVLDAAAQGNVNDVVAAKKQLPAARELLDGLELVLKTYQKKANDLKEKEPEALKIRKCLSEDWPTALTIHEELKRIQSELRPTLGKITAWNNKSAALASQHKALIGEKIYTPAIPVPPELYAAANVKLEPLAKSLDVRLPSERERDRVENQLRDQRPIVWKFLKRAKIEDYPRCGVCQAELIAQRYELDQAESKGIVEMRCPKHGDQWLTIQIPGRPSLSAAGHPLPNVPVPLADVTGPAAAKTQSHGLADLPSLTEQHKGGKTK